MKDMNKAERIIWSKAQQVVKTAQGKVDFASHHDAVVEFNVAKEMALTLEQTTESRVAEIVAMAKSRVY